MDSNTSGSILHGTIYVPQDERQSLGQLVFGGNMIFPINHVADWRYTHQLLKTKINKDINCENTTRINHDYIVGGKVITKNRSAYK